MKNCTDCKHALWDETKAGRLHPKGGGVCKYPWRMPALPQSLYWPGRTAPSPFGGFINRHQELKDHCAYYERKV